MISSAFRTQAAVHRPAARASRPARRCTASARPSTTSSRAGCSTRSSSPAARSRICMLFASMAAFGLVRFDFWGRDLVLGSMIALMVIPPVVLVIPLFSLGVELNLINTFRLVILIYVGLMLPFSIYMLWAFFRTIPARAARGRDGRRRELGADLPARRAAALRRAAGDARRRQRAVGLERAAVRPDLPAERLDSTRSWPGSPRSRIATRSTSPS